MTTSATLTEDQVALLKEPHFAQLVTLRQDGSPHISPVWVDTDGRHVIINTEQGRVKVGNMRRDPRVALSVFDPANPYTRVVNITGRVVQITREGAAEHIDRLAKKYMGVDRYPMHNPDKARLIVKIAPEQVT